MKYGRNLPNGGACGDARTLAEFAHLAEEAGDEITLLPRPVQTPRIPIWVGGGWPLKGPAKRATRWDRACFNKHSSGGSSDEMMPEDVRAL